MLKEFIDRLEPRMRELATTPGAWLGAGAVVVLGGVALFALGGGNRPPNPPLSASNVEVSSQARRFYRPTEAEWASLVIETVQKRAVWPEQFTEGKISIDEDRATPIFSPYSGRVTKLLAKPGDFVERGQPLFVVETNDTVQTLSDFMSAVAAVNKARSALSLAQTVEKRNRDLYEGKAVPLKDLQQAQADLTTAQNDFRTSETVLEAARSRLRILGRTDAEISAFEQTGKITSETPIYAPISGTVVQRKIGPGQFVGSGSSDPVFVIGDLSTVWLVAYVREADASKVQIGQKVGFTVLAYPDRVFDAKISHVAASLDPVTRRLMIRATVDNPGAQLKPEMFATVGIFVGEERYDPVVPREAVIYEGATARVWVVGDDKTIEARQVKPGIIAGGGLQILEGLQPGERIVAKGSLFIDRAGAGS
jgi:cobalt-zinc-cadmium efflux system membrane fusion protein